MVLSKLLYRKWFTRVWVLQKLVAASAAEVVCGNASISWSVLEIAFGALRDLFSECLCAVDGIDDDLPSWVLSWTEVRHPIYLTAPQRYSLQVPIQRSA